MLVVKLKPGERLFIGETWVQVLRSDHGGVKLGVEADREIPVDRESVREKKMKEAKLAAIAAIGDEI